MTSTQGLPSTDSSIWDKEIPVPPGTISYVDDAVLKKLQADGESAKYFIKVHQGKQGKNMASSEADAMALLHSVMPDLVATPFGWGEYEAIPDTYFFVVEFHPMSDDIPDVTNFPALVAEMHERSVSPDGKFGLSIQTYGGFKPVYFPVTDTWEECFSGSMRHTFAAERESQGGDDEFDALTEAILERVIPRLLRPLETEGRSIVPRLVHGDLWDGNASIDVETGEPLIFDPTPLYAHNEYELSTWNIPRHKMTQAYIEEYTKHFPKTEPIEEFWDRVQLYTMRFDLHASSVFRGNLRFRNIAREYMRKLVEKYGEGYEGYMARKYITQNANAFAQNRGLDVTIEPVASVPGEPAPNKLESEVSKLVV